MPSPSPARSLLLALVAAGCVTTGDPSGGGSPLGGADAGGGDSPRLPDGGACPVSCDPLDCPAGYHPGGLPGDCCPAQCLPDDCTLDECIPLDCPSGSAEVVPSGECCPVCGTSALPAASCEDGRSDYQEVRAAILRELGALRCEVDAECRAVALQNPCEATCAVGLRGATVAQVTQRLAAEARVRCAACEGPPPSCPAGGVLAYCAGGTCAAR